MVLDLSEVDALERFYETGFQQRRVMLAGVTQTPCVLQDSLSATRCPLDGSGVPQAGPFQMRRQRRAPDAA
jgi:hypothetical protein